MTGDHSDTVPGATCPWDGAPGWPRPRLVPGARTGTAGPAPACFVQSDPTDPTSADPARLQQVFSGFDCQVCAAPIRSVDAVGWVLAPVANMGGACCTRCMYLAARSCPHLHEIADGAWTLWAVTDRRDYTWHRSDGTADGHVVVDPGRAVRHDWTAFLAHRDRWRDTMSRCSLPS